MQRIKINDENVMREAVEVIKNGGVVAHPAETCYGLAADYLNHEALKKVFALKKRPIEKKLLVLVASEEEVSQIAQWTRVGKNLADKFWPGPLTIVLPSGEDTLAIRLPGDDFSRELVKAAGVPLVSTSANLSGEDNPYSAEDVVKLNPDLLVDGGIIPKNPPTTVVDCTGDAPKILRLGEISEDEILENAKGSSGDA